MWPIKWKLIHRAITCTFNKFHELPLKGKNWGGNGKKWKIFEKCPFLSVMWRNFFIIIIEQNLEVPFIIIVGTKLLEIINGHLILPVVKVWKFGNFWRYQMWPLFWLKVPMEIMFLVPNSNNLQFPFRQKNCLIF